MQMHVKVHVQAQKMDMNVDIPRGIGRCMIISTGINISIRTSKRMGIHIDADLSIDVAIGITTDMNMTPSSSITVCSPSLKSTYLG